MLPRVRQSPLVGVAALCCLLALLLGACAPLGGASSSAPKATPTPTTIIQNGHMLYSPEQFRAAYGVTSLLQRGYTGKGQTVVLIESFGSPTVQQDLDVYNRRFGLPPLQLKILAPIGTVPFDPTNRDMVGWLGETEEDVETIHALAPDAQITILTSPVSETEGTVGMPQFLQLLQYAVQNHLGTIISQSWAASEATLTDQAGQQTIQQFDQFYQQATTQDHITFFGSSGDNGATDYADVAMTHFATTPTVNFPASDPWVTAVGGTQLTISGGAVSETGWSYSGGGFSAFYPQPSFQKTLSAAEQTAAAGHRGVPDIAASADTTSGLAIYVDGEWGVSNGTSAGSPTWAALIAIADQMAGHPLGYLNPALYSLAASNSYSADFRDITQGNNSYTDNGVNVQGYSCAAGWDPVTGLGSPNAAHLLPALIAAQKG